MQRLSARSTDLPALGSREHTREDALADLTLLMACSPAGPRSSVLDPMSANPPPPVAASTVTRLLLLSAGGVAVDPAMSVDGAAAACAQAAFRLLATGLAPMADVAAGEA